MDNITLTPTSPLDGFDAEIAGNRLWEQTHAVVSVAVPLGVESALKDALRKDWGLDFPDHKTSTVSGEIRALRTGPDQLFLVFPHDGPDAARLVDEKLAGAGYTTDQTDAWVQLCVKGPAVDAALERLSPVDLSAPAFPIDAAARTIFEHMGAIVIRSDEDSFVLMSAASSAQSFSEAIITSFENVS